MESYKKYLIDKLENVQRRFTKRIPSISHLPYKDRLLALALEPLELRRLHSDIIQYFKIITNLTSLQPDKFVTLHYSPTSLRHPDPYTLSNLLIFLPAFNLLSSTDILTAGMLCLLLLNNLLLYQFLNVLLSPWILSYT